MIASATGARRSRFQPTPGAAILAVIVLALLLYLVVPLRVYVDQRNRLSLLERQTQILERQNAELLIQVQRLNDPDYIEQLARCLGMVKPGEIGFTLVPRGGAGSPASC